MSKYDHIDFKPPVGVAEEAEKGLEWRSEYGRGGTDVGVQRAKQLKNRQNISPDTIKRMVNFFSRHGFNEGKNKDENGEPTAWRIAWALWGGNPGRAWCNKVKRQMDAADKKAEAVAMLTKSGIRVVNNKIAKADVARAMIVIANSESEAGFKDILAGVTLSLIAAFSGIGNAAADSVDMTKYLNNVENNIKVMTTKNPSLKDQMKLEKKFKGQPGKLTGEFTLKAGPYNLEYKFKDYDNQVDGLDQNIEHKITVDQGATDQDLEKWEETKEELHENILKKFEFGYSKTYPR